MIVTLWSALVFIALAAALGVPLVNGITHLADGLPGYIASAQHGRGWIGHLAEVWQATAPDEPREPPAPAAEPADEDASGSCPRNAGGGALVS